MKIKAVRDMSDYGIDLQKEVKYAYPKDVGIDLVACESKSLAAYSSAVFPTGIAVEFPTECFGLILPRSSLAKSLKLGVLGGVIDEGYRGEIMVNLINHGDKMCPLGRGARIAQLVVLPYYKASLDWMEDYEYLTQTKRGDRGHGSTGR
jgi:dUTP pyrophosphatase